MPKKTFSSFYSLDYKKLKYSIVSQNYNKTSQIMHYNRTSAILAMTPVSKEAICLGMLEHMIQKKVYFWSFPKYFPMDDPCWKTLISPLVLSTLEFFINYIVIIVYLIAME